MTNVTAIEAFSDPTRRQLLERLRAGPCSVSELVDSVAVSQSAVSQHLRVLRDARLVQVRRQGQQRIYSLDPEGLAELRIYLESFWEHVLGAYQEAAAHTTQEGDSMRASDTMQSTIAPVTKSFVVRLPVREAFQLFTAGINRWWPLGTHSVFGDQAISCAVDARAGGRVYEVHADGRTSEWGRVLAWEPPHRLACSWYPGRDSETAQELEVTFQGEAGGTRVTLVHAGWEHLGEDGPQTRANYDTGWDGVLQAYAALAAEGGPA
jgi:DNA-binding transcriptional ArsR family regulator/uncharacterized protein YndB with AHSA1/START domain